MDNTLNNKTILISEFEEFYYQTCEDYHLWDEIENGIYPVKRIFDAMDMFLKNKKNDENL